MPFWTLVGILKVSIGSYITGSIITRMLKLPYYRPFILPVALIIFSVAFIPANVSETVWVDLNVVRTWGWIPAFFLPVVLLAVAVITKKPGKKHYFFVHVKWCEKASHTNENWQKDVRKMYAFCTVHIEKCGILFMMGLYALLEPPAEGGFCVS